VEQFMEEGHLRWDSLGEFLALAVSLEFYGTKNANKEALVIAEALDMATEVFLNNDRSPSRKVGELDTRGSHFYLALYWAQALAAQDKHPVLQNRFKEIAQELETHTPKILEELKNAQGSKQQIGGYYKPDPLLIEKAMRPSNVFNKILKSLG
jgi:isocitrate dehydrogenase